MNSSRTIRFLLFVHLFSLLSFSQDLNVALDIGHLPTRSGAQSARGISEYYYNRKMALSIYYALQEAGIRAFFVNADEGDISLGQRAKVAARYGATHFISIHHDSVKKQFLSSWHYHGKKRKYCDDFSGFSLFVSKKNGSFLESKALASRIGANLIASGLHHSTHHTLDIQGERKEILDARNGVLRYDNLVVLKRNQIPAVLLECGVIVNRDEERLIDTPAYRKKIGHAIVSALLQGEEEF